MITAKNITEARSLIKRWKSAGDRIALVPTMGNLHEGHLSLCEKAGIVADRVVVSIYVNPLQFGANEDLDRYPRTLKDDQKKLTEIGADMLFTPDNQLMYRDALEKTTQVSVPGVSDILCGQSRPGHFTGVATVVAKLFNIFQPDVAVFGEKDYQQLFIIKRMVKDLFMPIQIEGVATKREADGLAMSSRNGFLSEEQRKIAPTLYQVLSFMRERIVSGDAQASRLEVDGMRTLSEAGFQPEYLTIRRSQDLAAADLAEDKSLVILAAAKLGDTRLIDNVSFTLQ